MAAPATLTIYNFLRDQTGAGIANATVTCTFNYNQATVLATGDSFTQQQQTTTTDGTGRYQFTVVGNDLLSPANTTYTIKEPTRSYDIAPLSTNGSSQQTTAANVIVNAPGALGAISLTLGSIYGAVPFQGPDPWYDVKHPAYAAKGDGATDDTTAIQAAINAANTAGGGVVWFPPGTYVVSAALKYYPNIILQGAGGLNTTATGGLSVISQKVGTADVFLKPNAVASANGGVIIRDLAFTAFNAQATNTGGILLQSTQGARVERVQVAYANTYGFKVLAGATAGDSMYNTFLECVASNLPSGAAGFYLQSQGATTHPDGNSFIDCWVNGAGTGWRIDSNGFTPPIDSWSIQNCRTIAVATPINADGKWGHVMGNRFEVTSGGMTITLATAATVEPTAVFVANEFATGAGALTWTDSGAVKSPRYDWGSTEFPAFAATYAPDLRFGTTKVYTMTGAQTINAALNPWPGALLTLVLTQDVTGSRVITWNAAYNTNWQPGPDANNTSSITFVYDGAHWQVVGTSTLEHPAGYLYVPGGVVVTGAYISASGRFRGANSGNAYWDASGGSGTHNWRTNDGGTVVMALDQTGKLTPAAQVYPGDQALTRQTSIGLLSASGIPANGNGNNNDWCISDNGHIYFKAAGTWSQKV